MENLQEFLKQADVLQTLASIRGKELVKAKGKNRYEMTNKQFELRTMNVRLHPLGADLRFAEVTGHDFPEKLGEKLSIRDLEMTDKEWETHLQKIKIKREAEDNRLQKEKEERKLKQEFEEFQKLKRKFDDEQNG